MADQNDKGYFSIHVPRTDQRSASYIRVGSPDRETEESYSDASGGAPRGSGIALYADEGISLDTTDLKVTVSSSTRTVLGTSYSETWDVGETQITPGTLANDIANKRLITATLTAREKNMNPKVADRADTDAAPLWRTTKWDRSKALTYSISDIGSFLIGSKYDYIAGLKLANNLTGAFDTTLVDVKVPFIKVELGDKRCETTYWGGKLTYNQNAELRGESVTLGVGANVVYIDKVAGYASNFAWLTRAFLIASELLILEATALPPFLGSAENATTGAKDWLTKASLPFYSTITTINGLLAAAGLVLGLVQIMGKKKLDSPGTDITLDAKGITLNYGKTSGTSITLDAKGITLKCSDSLIELTSLGVDITGATVKLNGITIDMSSLKTLFNNSNTSEGNEELVKEEILVKPNEGTPLLK